MVLELVGVVGVIVLWNFFLLMVIWKIVLVLVCGCIVVFKLVDEILLIVLCFGQLCLEVGILLGVVNIVIGMGVEVGVVLVVYLGIDKLVFIGLILVGKLIGYVVVENMMCFFFEFGGKFLVIIFDDISLDMVVVGFVGVIFFNQGQVCIVGLCFYVQCKCFDQVLECLVVIVGDLSIGFGLDLIMQINLLVLVRQQEWVLGMIESGVVEGVSVVCGGVCQGEMGFYVQLMIFVDVILGMQVVCEEIFGLVLVVMFFDDFDEVVCLVNDSIYGFGVSIWFNDLCQVMDLVFRIKVGMVWVNVYNLFDLLMLFGGFKQFGIGCEMGYVVIEVYIENKLVCIVY